MAGSDSVLAIELKRLALPGPFHWDKLAFARGASGALPACAASFVGETRTPGGSGTRISWHGGVHLRGCRSGTYGRFVAVAGRAKPGVGTTQQTSPYPYNSPYGN